MTSSVRCYGNTDANQTCFCGKFILFLAKWWDMSRLHTELVYLIAVGLKREATARSEVRDKVKEDKPAAVKEEKEPEQQEHNKTPPQATQAGAMK